MRRKDTISRGSQGAHGAKRGAPTPDATPWWQVPGAVARFQAALTARMERHYPGITIEVRAFDQGLHYDVGIPNGLPDALVALTFRHEALDLLEHKESWRE